jgi:hypothetical protein
MLELDRIILTNDVSLTRCWEWAKAELSLSTPERNTVGGGKDPMNVNVGTRRR